MLGEPEEYRDASIAVLQIALDRFNRSLSLTITAKKFHKDQAPRTHLLPSDVLVPMLRESLPVVRTENRWPRGKAGFAIRDYFVRLHLLRRVCRDWRDVIDDNPSFWTYISPECPETVVDKALRKSGSAPLFLADSPAADGESYVKFMNRISIHAHRWETIIFHHIPSMSIARSVFCEPIPALREASIKVASGAEGAQTPINLFSGHAKFLRALSMHSLPVEWASPFFTDLRSFELSSSGRQGETTLGISPHGLLQLVATMPYLEDLVISNPALDGNNTSWASTEPSIPVTNLCHLQRLGINDNNGTLVPRFIKFFRIPACRDISLNCCTRRSQSLDSLQEELLETTQHSFAKHFWMGTTLKLPFRKGGIKKASAGEAMDMGAELSGSICTSPAFHLQATARHGLWISSILHFRPISS